ncbi:MAG: META domain-containing protein [Oceanospirillaceae bacterium]|nr:META domain-containing protein [Oceanospirillaceae bacterium]
MKRISLLAAALWLGGCTATLAPEPALQDTAVSDRLAGSRWRVETIAGKPLPASIESTVEFGPDGRLFGMAGCNRYRGRYRLDGDTLQVQQLVTTRKLCFPTIMIHEQSLLRVLQGARRIEREQGQLLLESRNEQGVSRMAAIDVPEQG